MLGSERVGYFYRLREVRRHNNFSVILNRLLRNFPAGKRFKLFFNLDSYFFGESLVVCYKNRTRFFVMLRLREKIGRDRD